MRLLARLFHREQAIVTVMSVGLMPWPAPTAGGSRASGAVAEEQNVRSTRIRRGSRR